MAGLGHVFLTPPLELAEQQDLCSLFQSCSLLVLALAGFFHQGLFFSHSPLCELFNLPLQKGRECGWEGR